VLPKNDLSEIMRDDGCSSSGGLCNAGERIFSLEKERLWCSMTTNKTRTDDSQFIDFTPLPPSTTRTPRTPFAPEDSRLLPSQPISPSQPQQRPLRSPSLFAPSPLKSTGAPPSSFNPFSRSRPSSSTSHSTPSRPPSRGSTSRHPTSAFFPSTAHAAADDNVMAALGLGAHNTSGLPPAFPISRGSMVLYRLADEKEGREGLLLPPNLRFVGAGSTGNRDSAASSSSASSFMSFTDSKHHSKVPNMRGLVPYAYDPSGDENQPMDEEDLLHDPRAYAAFKSSSKAKGAAIIPGGKRHSHSFPWRGIANFSVIVFLILALLCLFIFYPVFTFYRNEALNKAIDGNIRINGTGVFPAIPPPLRTN